jgi:anion-transporting  ArsA/GET3 family ATPase
MNKKTNLHIFLGAGGVGKTTISASFAMYLASKGKKTGLLSIDPAKRLKSALNASHIDEEGKIFWSNTNNGGYLRAAILNLPDSLKRWIVDEGLPEEHQRQLFQHPLYTTLAEKIASATETLAPIRMAEWLEQYPETEELIIDTAPGLHAVDFITRPEKLMAFFDSKILQWIKWFTGEKKWKWVDGKKEVIQDQNIFQKIIRQSAKGILSALGKAGGENILLTLGELILLMDQVFYKMVDRLEESRKWIRDTNTKVYFVFTLRDDSVSVAIELKQILEKNNIKNFIFLLNKSVPDSFINSKEVMNVNNVFSEIKPHSLEYEELLNRYIQSFPILKNKILTKLEKYFIPKNNIIEIPIVSSIENYEELKISDLIELGSYIEHKNKIMY